MTNKTILTYLTSILTGLIGLVVFIGLLSFMCTGCLPKVKPKKDDNMYKTIVIDSCEYIEYSYYDLYSLVHKGNCKFCIGRKHK